MFFLFSTPADTRFSSIRSPGPVTPRDVECEGFHLTYPRIATSLEAAQTTSTSASGLVNNIDQKVHAAIETFLQTLSQIGPELLSVSWKWGFGRWAMYG